VEAEAKQDDVDVLNDDDRAFNSGVQIGTAPLPPSGK